MTTLPTLPYAQTITAVNTPLNPLAGGSLGIGPTGLAGLAGQYPGVGPLPFRTPAGATGLFGGSAGVGGLPRLGATGAGQLADVATLRPLASGGGLRSTFALAPGVSKLGALGRVGLGATLGQLGSTGIDALNPGGQNSNIEQGLQGAALGAGIGGSIGSIVPGIGTAIGAGLGAVGGGAIGVLANTFGLGGGDDKEEAKPLDVLATAITSANLTPDVSENILQTYDTLMALAEQQPEGEARDAARQQAFDQTAQLVLSSMQQQQAEADMVAGMSGSSLLAMQRQAQQIFEPVAQDIEDNASLYAQAVNGIRGSLPASYQSVADLGVASELSSADRLANAYRAQAALTPIAERLTQYGQQQQSFANQQYQQMLAQQAAGGGAGSPSDVLSQLTG